MSPVEYRILGPVEVRTGAGRIRLAGVKQRTMLTALLLATGKFLSERELNRLLWGSQPPATCDAQIYNHISRLRKALGAGVITARRGPAYQLSTDGASFDLAEFEALAARGQVALRAGRWEDASGLLRAGLARWRGPALADVSEHLANAEGPRLEEIRVNAVESLIEAELAMGRHTQALPELTSLVARHPLRERFRAQLMTTLYRCDRQAEALAVYEQSRRLLADELGIEPGLRLRDVHHAILTADPALRCPA